MCIRDSTYTVDKNGVYTLKDINDTYAKGDKVGQSKTQAGDIEIDKKHVSLEMCIRDR